MKLTREPELKAAGRIRSRMGGIFLRSEVELSAEEDDRSGTYGFDLDDGLSGSGERIAREALAQAKAVIAGRLNYSPTDQEKADAEALAAVIEKAWRESIGKQIEDL